MRFAFLTEADTPPGASVADRYHEIIREAQHCDAMGFDVWGCSEQHFVAPNANTSAPEVLLGAVAYATTHISIRPMSFVMLPFNHPIRTAERVATLDILTRGRFQLGTARGNNAGVIRAFEVDGPKTKSQWKEALELCVKALTQETVEWESENYKVGPTRVSPRLYSREMPKIFVSATSVESHRIAGELGLGVMHSSAFGWDVVEECIDVYKTAIQDAEPLGDYEVNDSFSHTIIGAHCAATREQAFEECRPAALGFAKWLSTFYEGLSSTSPDYEYLVKSRELTGDRADDLPYLAETFPRFLIGTPDDLIERLRIFEKMGIDEVILRMDGYGHQKIMNGIEMIGKYVIPEFKSPSSVARNGVYANVGVTPNPYML